MYLRIFFAFLLSFLGFISPLSVMAKQAVSTPPIAMADFIVNSANPSFAYLGKGFSEIIAFELMKSPGVKLVDREKRNQILKEMEFSMTGLTDPKSEIKMGRLLAVRYLVSGSITDMAGSLLVSLSMVDVESGAVVWKDQTTQPGGKYAYIGAYFSKSILKYFQTLLHEKSFWMEFYRLQRLKRRIYVKWPWEKGRGLLYPRGGLSRMPATPKS